jgi:hypothetical protein
MSQVGEFHLRDDQMNRVLAALLTIASVGPQVTPPKDTISVYEGILKQLTKGPVAKGFGHSAETS